MSRFNSRHIIVGTTVGCVLALGSWPVVSGRLGAGWLTVVVAAIGGSVLVASGRSGLLSAAPILLVAEYGASLRSASELDAMAIMTAAGVMTVVELQTWCLRMRVPRGAERGGARPRSVRLTWSRVRRLASLAAGSGAISGFVLLAVGDERHGPRGLGALAEAVLAVVAFAALLLLALGRPVRSRRTDPARSGPNR